MGAGPDVLGTGLFSARIAATVELSTPPLIATARVIRSAFQGHRRAPVVGRDRAKLFYNGRKDFNRVVNLLKGVEPAEAEADA